MKAEEITALYELAREELRKENIKVSPLDDSPIKRRATAILARLEGISLTEALKKIGLKK